MAFVHLLFIFAVVVPLCRFTLVYEGDFVFCYKEKNRAVGLCDDRFQEDIGRRDFRCYLHVALVEFDTSIMCHVLVYSFGSFLLQVSKYLLLREEM